MSLCSDLNKLRSTSDESLIANPMLENLFLYFPIVIFDFSPIDIPLSLQLVETTSSILKKLSKSGAAVLMASHDIFRIRETCDRIGILKNGELVKEIDTANVSTKELENIYIEYMKD